MGRFVYIATESIVAGHSVGDQVVLEIDTQDSRRSRRVEKDVQRSLGGAIEVLKHRSEVTWSIQFEPVAGYRLDLLRQFLDSTEGGEPFTMDLYGSSSSPTAVKRVDDGYEEQPFVRSGSAEGDYFQTSIEVVEV